ncbi:micrococcal nuclease [Bacillus sp. TE9122W]
MKLLCKLFILFLVFFISGCNSYYVNQTPARVEARLLKVIDGDTIKVLYKGKKTSVRLLLIDTPETKSPKTCVQPYGLEASKRLQELLKDDLVELEFEPEEDDKKDKYGRLLAYVYSDGKLIQKQLLEEGYARLAYIFKSNYLHLEQLEKSESIAKNKRINIWSTPDYVTSRGFSYCEL